MTGLGIVDDTTLLVASLAVLALGLFFLASRRGRWALWLAAYVLVVAALAAAFFLRDPAPVGEHEPHLALVDGVVEEQELVNQVERTP